MNLKKILFTDDDPDIRQLIRLCLEDSEFTFELCESGEETLQRIPLFKPDLIILDVLMPGMNGINTYDSIKNNSNLESIPVIFMTATNTEKEIKNLLELGAVDVIIKPFKPFAFAENLLEIWNDKIANNKNKN